MVPLKKNSLYLVFESIAFRKKFFLEQKRKTKVLDTKKVDGGTDHGEK